MGLALGLGWAPGPNLRQQGAGREFRAAFGAEALLSAAAAGKLGCNTTSIQLLVSQASKGLVDKESLVRGRPATASE